MLIFWTDNEAVKNNQRRDISPWFPSALLQLIAAKDNVSVQRIEMRWDVNFLLLIGATLSEEVRFSAGKYLTTITINQTNIAPTDPAIS